MVKPIIVTAAIIIKDKNVLLVKNKKCLQKSGYGFPGGIGGFEKSPDPAKAVIHEVKGDIGCEFNGSFFSYNFRNEDIPVITLFFVGSIEGKPRPICKNIIDVKYFSIAEALAMDLIYDHSFILKKYLQNNN